jgi:NAD(P)-dependent dehydrogenase (short-subunit alcohol dehydrogenase family)
VDLGLRNRRAFITGGEVAITAACARTLEAEGVQIATEASDCDIVIAHDLLSPRAAARVDDPRSIDDLRASWTSVVDTVAGYRAALPGMQARGWGRFVWIGSAQAKSVDSDDDEVDAIVSLAVMGLHKVVTGEEAQRGITANAVLRGGDATVDDVADTVTFLCSAGAAYLSGVTITVDGGAGSAVF